MRLARRVREEAMKAALSEVATDVHRMKQTGLLSVSVKGSNSLFKIFFRNGEIYHISHGASKGQECLAHLEKVEFTECSFVPDVYLDVSSVNIPSAEVLRVLQASARPIEASVTVRENGGSADALSDERFAAISEQLKSALIRQIGPVGMKVFPRIAEGRWRASAPPLREELLVLIDMLKEEIEDMNDRNDFIKDVRRIIS